MKRLSVFLVALVVASSAAHAKQPGPKRPGPSKRAMLRGAVVGCLLASSSVRGLVGGPSGHPGKISTAPNKTWLPGFRIRNGSKTYGPSGVKVRGGESVSAPTVDLAVPPAPEVQLSVATPGGTRVVPKNRSPLSRKETARCYLKGVCQGVGLAKSEDWGPWRQAGLAGLTATQLFHVATTGSPEPLLSGLAGSAAAQRLREANKQWTTAVQHNDPEGARQAATRRGQAAPWVANLAAGTLGKAWGQDARRRAVGASQGKRSIPPLSKTRTKTPSDPYLDPLGMDAEPAAAPSRRAVRVPRKLPADAAKVSESQRLLGQMSDEYLESCRAPDRKVVFDSARNYLERLVGNGSGTTSAGPGASSPAYKPRPPALRTPSPAPTPKDPSDYRITTFF